MKQIVTVMLLTIPMMDHHMPRNILTTQCSLNLFKTSSAEDFGEESGKNAEEKMLMMRWIENHQINEEERSKRKASRTGMQKNG